MITFKDDDIELTLSGDPLFSIVSSLTPLFKGLIHNAIIEMVCGTVRDEMNKSMFSIVQG